MSNPTPGPWFTSQPHQTIYIEARLRGSVLQEVAAIGPTEGGPSQQEANARLISAAPELLQAVLEAQALLTDERFGTWQYMESDAFYSDSAEVRKTLQAVIAKATGSQP